MRTTLMLLLFAGCGAATPTPVRPEVEPIATAAPVLPAEAVAAALLERFALPYCVADHCLDPFPLWAVSGIAVSGDRIALAGPGGLVSLYSDGQWTTLAAPVEVDEEFHADASVHAVGFSPDGETLIAVGELGIVYDVAPDGLSIRTHLPFDRDADAGSLTDVIVVSEDELWAVQAQGFLFRVRGEEISRREVPAPVQHLVPMGVPLDEALTVSGPFGGWVVRGAFGEGTEDGGEPQPFLLPEQLENLGLYSGCGPSMFDPRSPEIEELAGSLMDQSGMDYDAAMLEAERRTPRGEALSGPAGVHVPPAAIPPETLTAALASTAEGRALSPIVSVAPPNTGAPMIRRRGDAIAVAAVDWQGHAVLWARFGNRGHFFDGSDTRTAALGGPRALDVSRDQLLYVDEAGRLALLRAADESPTVTPPHPELARASAVLVIGNDRALVATEDGTLVPVALGDLSVGPPRAVPGTLRTLEGEGPELYGVGDDGLVLRITDTEIVQLESGVTADLTSVLVLGPRRLVMAGAAGTLVHLDEGSPRRLDRITSETIDELHSEEGVLYAMTERGVTLREAEGVLAARASSLPEFATGRAARGLMLRFAPRAEGAPFLSRTSPLAVAVDEPDARGPYGALRERFDRTVDAFPTERLLPEAAYRGGRLEGEIFAYDEGTYCCDPDYQPVEGELLIAEISSGCTTEDCGLLFRTDLRRRLVSLARQTHVTVSPAAPSGCTPRTVEVFSLVRARSVARDTFGCDAGEAAQRAAIAAHLSALEIDATWEPSSTLYSLRDELLASGTGFFARDARGRVEIVRAEDGNRAESVVIQLPRGTAPVGPRPVPVRWSLAAVGSDGYETDLANSAFEGPGLFWAGPTPRALSGSPEETPEETREETSEGSTEPTDPLASCERILVSDADGHTTLRAGPTSRSDALDTLENGSRVVISRHEGRWISISSPRAGWLYAPNVRCAD